MFVCMQCLTGVCTAQGCILESCDWTLGLALDRDCKQVAWHACCSLVIQLVATCLWVKRRSDPEVAQAHAYLVDAYRHSKEALIHNDLHPGNVLVYVDQRPDETMASVGQRDAAGAAGTTQYHNSMRVIDFELATVSESWGAQKLCAWGLLRLPNTLLQYVYKQLPPESINCVAAHVLLHKKL